MSRKTNKFLIHFVAPLILTLLAIGLDHWLMSSAYEAEKDLFSVLNYKMDTYNQILADAMEDLETEMKMLGDDVRELSKEIRDI